ncbi:MAG: tyrosine recombinase XerC [Clostridia bacterium]
MINHENNPDYLNSFLDYTVTILNKSPNTVKEYNYDLATFLKFIKIHFNLTKEDDFANITINDISLDTIKKIKLDDIHAFLSYLTNTYHSKAATRARKASSIRVFFNYLSQKANLIEFNPAQNLETPKLDKRLPKYLSLDDSKKLLEAAGNEENRNNKRDYAIITLFLNCGMRLSELVGINIKDINFSECQMTVIGKGNKERTIYLNNACMSAINNYLSVRPVEGIKTDKLNSKNALFLSERKERISRRTVQYIVDKELSAAGLDTNKYSVHKLRHTAATLMYQYGKVDIRALQEVLGHESISTTEIYTHVANVQARSAIENNPLADIKQD